MDDTTNDNGSRQSKEVLHKEKRPYFFREWAQFDIMRGTAIAVVHLFCLLAPFNYKPDALLFGYCLAVVAHIGITFSYHRNLAHRSFKLPKWLEYSFAYIAIFALQGHPIDWVSTHRFHHQFTDSDRDPHSPMEGFWFSHIWWIFDTKYITEKCGRRSNVMDLKKQWFYRFLANTVAFHILMLWTLVYFWRGLPYLCGLGFGGVIGYHGTWLINSACHIWGSKTWNTKDTSRNIWWLALLTNGESWHNNHHHAFEASARHGLEWYQVDATWYLIRIFETLGLATDVKLPSDAQKRKMAFAR